MTTPTQPVPDFLDNAACDPVVTWTTGNVAEAFPGVFTTLGFSYVHRPMEFAFRRLAPGATARGAGSRRGTRPRRARARRVPGPARVPRPERGPALRRVSWREDPAPVLARLADYRAIPAGSPRAPRRRGAEQERVRRAAAELTARISPLRRRPVGLLTDLTARFLALREQGKAGYLPTFDVARAAARRLGEHLVARGVIAEPNDVFHLHYDDLRGHPTGDQREAVAERRARYQERQQLRLPKAWAGVPEVTKVAGAATRDAAAGLVITGVAATGGVAEGRARVVRDPWTTATSWSARPPIPAGCPCSWSPAAWSPTSAVCSATARSWPGSSASCVCGTEDGSNRIRDGQRIRVDGDRGTVEVLH